MKSLSKLLRILTLSGAMFSSDSALAQQPYIYPKSFSPQPSQQSSQPVSNPISYTYYCRRCGNYHTTYQGNSSATADSKQGSAMQYRTRRRSTRSSSWLGGVFNLDLSGINVGGLSPNVSNDKK